MSSIRTLVTLMLALLSTNAMAAGETEMHAHDAWIREAPPGFTIMAAYLVLENHGKEKRTIVGVTSPDFDKVEMHLTIEEGGYASMKKIDALDVQANQHVVLAPGGSHLMLYDPKRQLKHGDEVEFVFTLANGEKFSGKAQVKKVLGSMKPADSAGKQDSGHQH